MKELRGAASGVVMAPVEDCIQLFEAVDRYPTWYPEVVRDVEVLERDDQGRATRARTSLHVSYGPLVRSFRLLLAVGVERPRMVKLTRLAHDHSDQEQFEVVWRLQEEGGNTRIRLELDANLSVPRLVPLGGVGDAMAEGFVAAATKALDTNRSQ
jgi:hypothetical protein